MNPQTKKELEERSMFLSSIMKDLTKGFQEGIDDFNVNDDLVVNEDESKVGKRRSLKIKTEFILQPIEKENSLIFNSPYDAITQMRIETRPISPFSLSKTAFIKSFTPTSSPPPSGIKDYPFPTIRNLDSGMESLRSQISSLNDSFLNL